MSHHDAQYVAIRDEVLRSIEDGNQILGFGIAAIGLVANAAISSTDKTLAIAVYLYLIPILQMSVTSMWFSAQERMARASHFLTLVESNIASEKDIPTSGMWEHWLRNRDSTHRHFWNTEYSVFLFQITVIIFSVSYGLFESRNNSYYIIFLKIAPLSILVTFFVATMRIRFKQWRYWLRQCSY